MASQLTEILDRLLLMHGEISGITEFRLPPPIVEQADLPIVYPIPGQFSEGQTAYGELTRVYRFTVEVLIAPVTQVTFSGVVSKLITDLETIIEATETYYDAHRMLSTTALMTPLDWVVHPGMSLACEGVQFYQPIISDDLYAGTVFELTIPAYMAVSDYPGG